VAFGLVACVPNCPNAHVARWRVPTIIIFIIILNIHLKIIIICVRNIIICIIIKSIKIKNNIINIINIIIIKKQ